MPKFKLKTEKKSQHAMDEISEAMDEIIKKIKSFADELEQIRKRLIDHRLTAGDKLLGKLEVMPSRMGELKNNLGEIKNEIEGLDSNKKNELNKKFDSASKQLEKVEHDSYEKLMDIRKNYKLREETVQPTKDLYAKYGTRDKGEPPKPDLSIRTLDAMKEEAQKRITEAKQTQDKKLEETTSSSNDTPRITGKGRM